MIDWYNLLLNACWILGCSIVLATLSYTSWEASGNRKTFRESLRQPKIQVSLNFGGLLFSLGLAGTTHILWQRLIWFILAIGFLIQIMSEFFRRKNSG